MKEILKIIYSMEKENIYLKEVEMNMKEILNMVQEKEKESSLA